MPGRLLTRSDPEWFADVDAVLIDVDGTLVDSTAAVERLWRTFLEWYDLPPSAFPEPLHGKRAEDHIRGMLPAHLVEAATARLVLHETHDVEGTTAIAGAAELLESLDAAGIVWAVVTSCTVPVAEVRLRASGLRVPAVMVTAEDVERGKPHPDPYLLGRSRLGDPATCLALEDAPAGIASARDAGCRVVALSTTHAAEDLDSAELVLPDLTSLYAR